MTMGRELLRKSIFKKLESVTEKTTKELAGEKFLMVSFKFLIIAEMIGQI